MKRFEGYCHGINLGGWLSQCNHTKERYDTFTTESDIERIASWGLDHIRVPVDYELVETDNGEYLEAGFAYIQKSIDWCRKYKLNMILDVHKTAGYSFDDPNSSGFFTSAELQERFINLWRQFAKRFGCNRDMLAFELLNEIVSYSNEWNSIAQRAICAIREYEPDIKILVGSTDYNSLETIRLLDNPHDENIVFNFHCYEPLIYTHQSAYWVENMPKGIKVDYPSTLENLRQQHSVLKRPSPLDNQQNTVTGKPFFELLLEEAVQIAEKYDVPLYCGEYGVIDQADTDSTLRWYRDITAVFDKYGIGRAAWSYKEMDFGIIGEHYAPIFDELIKLL